MTGVAGQLEPLYPVIALLGGAMVVVLLGLILDRQDRAVLPVLSLMAVGLAIVACGEALANAILTRRECISSDTRERLGLLIGHRLGEA